VTFFHNILINMKNLLNAIFMECDILSLDSPI